MDNQLTPNKIQRLMHLAEDKSYIDRDRPRKILHADGDLKRLATINQASLSKSNATVNCEGYSSGILDLDKMEGFGESGIGLAALSKSTAFDPSEMTGRSTGAEDVNLPLSRHSIALESLTSQMDKQTFEIQDIMRHSIATNYSFHSKRDLTADEASLVVREAPLPVQCSTHTHFSESASVTSNLSVGAYFKNRCPNFSGMLTKIESPDKSFMASFTEAFSSTSNTGNYSQSVKKTAHKIDPTLDCIPVRQPRNEDVKEKSSIRSKTKMLGILGMPLEMPNEELKSQIRDQTEQFYLSQVVDKPKYVQMELNSLSPEKGINQQKADKPPKDADLLIKKMHGTLKLTGEDTEGSVNSFSISKIADYLGKQSNVSVTDMIQYNNQKKQTNKNQPPTDILRNISEDKIKNNIHNNWDDSQQIELASSAAINKYKKHNIVEVPAVLVTQDSVKEQLDIENKSKRITRSRSKSPSSKSQSTLTTVKDNFNSFKSGDSPLHTSRGEANTSRVPSPNRVYKELDKSVDWYDVMHQKRLKQEGLAKGQWVDITSTPAIGYIGIACPVTLTVKTLTENWLAGTLQFVDLPDEGKNLTITLPSTPLLFAPNKTEKITFYITSTVEMHTSLNITTTLKDTTVDRVIEQKSLIEVNIDLPTIQVISSDGVNKITFPPIHANTSFIKSFVLVSDCPADLCLQLSVIKGSGIFAIKSVQEIKKAEINKALMDQQETSQDELPSKSTNNQVCRLTDNNAIKITVKFKSPKLSPAQTDAGVNMFNGKLNVNLFGLNTLLRTVDIFGVVGTAELVLNTNKNKLYLSHEHTCLELCNKGTISGTWNVKFSNNLKMDNFPFQITESKFDIWPGSTITVKLCYTGSVDTVCEATLIFEEVTTGHRTSIEISNVEEQPKSFPIKTNYTTMSWVRPGRKELSLKNVTKKKIYIKCQISGDGFAIDLPRDSRGGIYYSIPFGPSECRSLPIMFTPLSNIPHNATLKLVFDKNDDFCRKIPLYGCSGGESIRWYGLATYGDAALVRAISRRPINMELQNKSSSPVFVYARVNFNLQYTWLSQSAQLSGARHVVGARSRHALSLCVEWARLERRARFVSTASTFATVTVLTGAETTRRRILKILRNSSSGELDTSLLPDNLKVLAEKFEGEDDSIDRMIAHFDESKSSLSELIGGLQELSAQIDLPDDFADENTILISDDSALEFHTLCD